MARYNGKICRGKFNTKTSPWNTLSWNGILKSSLVIARCPDSAKVKVFGNDKYNTSDGYLILEHLNCVADYIDESCINLVNSHNKDHSICQFCDTAYNINLRCNPPTTLAPTTPAPTTTAPTTTAPTITTQVAPAAGGQGNETIVGAVEVIVPETPNILAYALGAVGGALVVTVAAYPFTCWAIDGLLLRKNNWLKSPLIRGQQFLAWCRGKNKTEESSIEMASNDDDKVEEDNSFLNEGDENTSAKKQKVRMLWVPITSAQKFYGWCRGKNKPEESSIDMDSNGDEKVEEYNYFLNKGVEHVRAKKKKGKLLLQSYPSYSSSKC